MDNILRNNMSIKLISILVAVLLWMYVIGEQNPYIIHIYRDVPVKLNNLDTANFALKEEEAGFKVSVRVRGRRATISELTKSEIKAEVNLRGRMEGENLIPVAVTVPDNVELLDINPPEIMVTLEPIIEKQVPIVVRLTGTPAGGFAAMDPSAKPGEAVLKGARSVVESVKSAFVSVDISGKNRDVKGNFPLRVVDEKNGEVKNITFRPETVDVIVPIVKKADVEVIPKITGSPAGGYAVSDITVVPLTLSVTGEDEVVESLNELYTEGLDITGLSQDIQKEVKVILPEGVRPVRGEKDTVTVFINIEKEVEGSLKITKEVDVINLQDGYEAVIEPVEITLNFKGLRQFVDNVKEDDINIYVNLKNLKQGVYNAKLQVGVPENITLLDYSPKNISVEIREKQEDITDDEERRKNQ
ncbi:CdaA regulatory protein CdaR [Koleobacter methoxysyntrophicus]|uniref:CdaA regulatory protein CdaR n=1 Tax=Koleobacter methoxysyntrophicus TaxID=2751313 RepID=A0A8A0RM42_9FIRM|nr:CdaR family protein [Koleobacter methoxysyntrophicus]QSQ08276.1 CdaA regulatory protein CdaR [Koleobacter methoxysyntrophicus]